MNKRWLFVPFLMTVFVLGAVSARAQAGGPEKPRLYTYVSYWTIPRAQWGEMDKSNEASMAVLEKLVADGTIIGYGFNYTAAHEPTGSTHGDWIQANSIAGIFKALDALRTYATSAARSSLVGSGPHGDLFLVSRNYNAHSGTFNDGILRVIGARVKPGHMAAYREVYTKYLMPVYERLLAEGAIHAYDLQTEWNVTSPPDTAYVVTVATNAEGEDRRVAAINDAFEKNPAILDALASATEPGSRHDFLARVTLMRHK